MPLPTKLSTRRARGVQFARGNRVTLVRRFPGGREIELTSARTRRRAVQEGIVTLNGSTVSGGYGGGSGGSSGPGGGGPVNPNESWP